MLTRKQYKFLKKVSKNDIPCDGLNQNRDRIFLYLLERKLISTYNFNPDNDIMEENSILYCRTTEHGEVELQIYRQENYRFWIPTILSIIAIIASFLVVLTQNAELWLWLKGLLQ